MTDSKKTKAQLVAEVKNLRKRAEELEAQLGQYEKAASTLLGTETWMPLVMKHSADGIDVCKYEPKGDKRTLVMCNDRYVEMSGRSREELMAAEDLNQLVKPVEHRPANFLKRYSDGLHIQGVASWIRPDGKENYYEWVSAPFKIGDELYTIGIDRDITARKRAEQQLHDFNDRLNNIIEFLPDATFVIDQDKKVIAWNRAMEEKTGVKKEEILGKGDRAYSVALYGDRREILIDLIDKQDREIEGIYGHVERRGNTVFAEVFAPREHEGKGGYYWITATPLLDAEGNAVGAIESIRNITYHRRAEKELQEREEAERTFRERLQALYEVNAELTMTDSVRELCRRAVELGRSQLGFDRLGIWFTHQEKPNTFIGSYGTDHKGRLSDRWGCEATYEPSHLLKLILSRKSLAAQADDQVLYDYRKGAVGRGAKALAALWDGRNVLGYLAADNLLKAEPITKEQTELLKLLATTLGHLYRRKEVEEALRQSEEKYRTLAENTNDILYSATPDGTITYIGPQVARYERRPEEIISRSLLEFVSPEDRDRLSLEFEETISTGREFPSEFRIEDKAGRTHWVEDHGKVQRDESGKIIGITGVLRDITERKLAEETLRDSEQRYRTLFENSPVALWENDYSQVKKMLDELRASGVKDLRSYLGDHPEVLAKWSRAVKIIAVNKATLDLYEAETIEDLLADQWPDYPDEMKQRFREMVLFLWGQEITRQPEARDRTVTGKDIYTVSRWSIPPGYKDTCSRILISTVDITDLKRAQTALAEAHRRLLGTREEERRRLARELHDSIGQQLVAVHLSLKAVLTENGDRFDETAAEVSVKLSDQFNDLIREVRRICHGLYPQTLESLGLVAALRQLATESQVDVEITVRCPEHLETRRFGAVVEVELFRIAQEAVNNALRHARAKRIDLRLDCKDHRLTLAITDNGKGFDPSGQAEHGIGLSTMNERAKAIGAELEISSKPGKTCVSVSATVEEIPSAAESDETLGAGDSGE